GDRERHQGDAQAEEEHDGSAAARDAHGFPLILPLIEPEAVAKTQILNTEDTEEHTVNMGVLAGLPCAPLSPLCLRFVPQPAKSLDRRRSRLSFLVSFWRSNRPPPRPQPDQR